LALATGLLAAEAPAPHVLVISVDGMRPASYTQAGPAKIPTLRRLAREGAWAEGMTGVLPTVTYPSHTTMITGVPPARHGIVNNTILDPEGLSRGAWYWYARQIRVPTLPGAVRARGLTVGAVSWPVTVGMDLDYSVPEFPRSQHAESLHMLAALSRPDTLFASYEQEAGTPGWPLTDADRAGMAAWIMRTFRPNLMLVHIFDNDSASHGSGPESPEALAALEESDGHVARILEAAWQAGIGDRLKVVVLSDHGFIHLEQRLQLNALFRERGLLDVDDEGRITGWRAYFKSAGGSASIHLAPDASSAVRTQVEAILADLVRDPANGIEKVWTPDDLAEVGAYPDAAFAVTMRPGFYTGGAHDRLLAPIDGGGGHGFDPARPEMQASLIVSGPGLSGIGSLGQVRMTQVGPTIARWFGVQLSPDADEPLTALLQESKGTGE
ncbi:MAG TPA: ectonucleotide pyrophosphatase/phosphodiesterase, partial [Methylomirabilota bacterium]